MRLTKLFLLSFVFVSYSLQALTYEETVRAFEQALERQSVEVYRMKQKAEEQKQKQLSQAYLNLGRIARQQELEKMQQENSNEYSR